MVLLTEKEKRSFSPPVYLEFFNRVPVLICGSTQKRRVSNEMDVQLGAAVRII